MQVKTVKDALFVKTVGGIKRRYRLGHLWVSEMMLNVQSRIKHLMRSSPTSRGGVVLSVSSCKSFM